ncbi:MAG: CoA-binding protein [Bdellovibrio sp.]|nr:MAG: CoA-binding protein [Bdellovibrio sp.]
MNVDQKKIDEILANYDKITVIGLSPDGTKPSQRVPLFMKSQGYSLVGVNPGQREIAGIKIYERLADVPGDYRKFVAVFRRPEFIPDLVDEILRLGGTEVLWLQLGITHSEAEHKAQQAGLWVVSDRCLKIEQARKRAAFG